MLHVSWSEHAKPTHPLCHAGVLAADRQVGAVRNARGALVGIEPTEVLASRHAQRRSNLRCQAAQLHLPYEGTSLVGAPDDVLVSPRFGGSPAAQACRRDRGGVLTAIVAGSMTLPCTFLQALNKTNAAL